MSSSSAAPHQAPCEHAKKYEELLNRNIAVLEAVEKKLSASGAGGLADLIKEKEGDVREHIKTFMLKHYNISFINDDLEGEVYDFLIDGIFMILNKVVL